MPDISMCQHPTCRMRRQCYRHADSGTQPSRYRQTYAHFTPGPAGCADLILVSEKKEPDHGPV